MLSYKLFENVPSLEMKFQTDACNAVIIKIHDVNKQKTFTQCNILLGLIGTFALVGVLIACNCSTKNKDKNRYWVKTQRRERIVNGKRVIDDTTWKEKVAEAMSKLFESNTAIETRRPSIIVCEPRLSLITGPERDANDASINIANTNPCD